MVANIILFLGVADDSKVVAKLKCNIWFQLHTKQMDVSLSDRSSFEVKYFVRYLCHIPIINRKMCIEIFNANIVYGGKNYGQFT